jgi:hypothetical protein
MVTASTNVVTMRMRISNRDCAGTSRLRFMLRLERFWSQAVVEHPMISVNGSGTLIFPRRSPRRHAGERRASSDQRVSRCVLESTRSRDLANTPLLHCKVFGGTRQAYGGAPPFSAKSNRIGELLRVFIIFLTITCFYTLSGISIMISMAVM